jgi:hypothetical protein
MDLKALKAEYSFKTWLERMNYFVCGGKTSKQSGLQELLPDGHCPPMNRKESLEFEEKELDNWWYDHYKDFSRYASWHYLYTGLNCFDRFSKPCAFYAHQYLSSNKKIKSIVDVGAGIGLSTMLLSQLFPDARVYYNNIMPSLQADFFEINKFYSNINSSNKQAVCITEKEMMQHGSFDMLFASEYFEHFEEPMKQTDFLLNQVGFKYLVVNNSFNVKAYGHFKEFKHNEILDMYEILEPKQTSKRWLKTVRRDYNELDVKCWNGRPKIFEKK